ncbi:Asp-tRNA(Asn)/Glu-tRNA(Gln) amidotransferase GatCAB subunit C [Siculibacillus lacustris]|uniref:Asp-tRNA(Asn)/Glu-tRNA(Gln) amidotransferase GatCAB subunit C n=1 Tax=Siculibacillus lacustris TaxID=1549641 RepID=A0A4Q9VZK2_9HYPH|nr:molybdopterin-dependent oxidoreductase [Siculibacillus lacustris]TBW41278.1 Asp-tRNA(Asn)/Glu-tRNA(Gln) amidotransferase GatCAB subunit C [Siculibacillus lacustris]
MPPRPPHPIVATHWGLYRARMAEDQIVGFDPFEADPDPSRLIEGVIAANDAPARIRRPAVRASFLAARRAGRTGRVEGEGRGREPFVEIGWDEALDLAAAELARVRDTHGNGAIFGGSYGWSSAGRFHHAQSQVHRFLNAIGGYTRSVQNYSFATADYLLPHVIGDRSGLIDGHTPWDRIADHAGLIVMFGGAPLKNAQVSSGGIARHIVGEAVARARENGARVICVSPLRADGAGEDVEWLPIRPGTDTALILALAEVLIAEDLVDRAFLERFTTGHAVFVDYVRGAGDGTPKTPEWAEAITTVPAATIRALARGLAATRSFLMVAWSLQRADFGEQPYWATIALAALLGQIGLPGGGFGFGYASVNGVGNAVPATRWPVLPQGTNRVADFIPVARIADALLSPGETYDFDGESRRYPDLRLIYWAGGNPFHHHQDLNRLRRAWQRPEAVIVNESWWNPLARHADIVLPATTALERDDIAASVRDRFVSPSHRVLAPVGEARDDYAIFSALAERLGAAEIFTEGLDTDGWLRRLWDEFRVRTPEAGDLPEFDRFWAEGPVLRPALAPAEQTDLLAEFRADPEANRLRTPSGRIELYSETVARFGYADCPGHPAWIPPREGWGSPLAARHPLHLLSNQPEHRLHSQYDHGGRSAEGKRRGREVVRLHAADAGARGIGDGDAVRLFNDRGACLAVAGLDDGVVPGVACLPTGAWWDPVEDGSDRPLDRHGNPNVLTADIGTSRLTQGPSAQSCLVEIERFDGPLPPVRAFDPPDFVELAPPPRDVAP